MKIPLSTPVPAPMTCRELDFEQFRVKVMLSTVIFGFGIKSLFSILLFELGRFSHLQNK